MSAHANFLPCLLARKSCYLGFLPRLGHLSIQRVCANCLPHGHWSKRKDYLASLRAAAMANEAKEGAGQGAEEWDLRAAGTSKDWQRSDLHVVLVHPQIPQNTGNVCRTCAATSVALHLVGPCGFRIDDKQLKRAGLDYWEYVCVAVHPSWEDFYATFKALPGPKRLIAFSKFARRHYAEEGMYQKGDWLMFGAETTGLPIEAHQAAVDTGGAVVKIPMLERHVRSLNLSTSVGIGVFEAIRQLDGAVLPEEQQLDPLAPRSDYNANAASANLL